MRVRAASGQGRVDLILVDAQGAPLVWNRIDQDYEDPKARRMLLRRLLAPGNCRLDREDERYAGWDKPLGSATFAIPAEEGDAIIIPLTLR